MFPLTTWGELYSHMEWADARVWAAVRDGAAASDLRSRELLSHLHMTQRAFLQLWKDVPRDLPDPATFTTLAGLQAWAQSYYSEVAGFLATLDASRLDARLAIPWAQRLEQRLGRAPAIATLADSLLQVPLHSVHHRAQINSRLRELGVQPPMVDYIAWVWYGKPAAEWRGTSHTLARPNDG